MTALAEPSQNHFQAVAYRLIPPTTPAARHRARRRGRQLRHRRRRTGRAWAGPLEVLGYAFAGDDRLIVRVDVSVDGGRHWREAELLGYDARWSGGAGGPCSTRPGELEIVARAWDSAAGTSPRTRFAVEPEGLREQFVGARAVGVASSDP